MRSHQYSSDLLILFIVALLLVSCSDVTQSGPAPQETPRVIVLSTDEVSPLSAPANEVSILPTPVPFQFPTDLSTIQVEPDKAVVIGRLISTITNQPIANTSVRMAKIYYAEEGNKDPSQGAWALDNAFSPYALTNEGGYFIFENVEPVDFVIFVGDIMDRYTVQTNEDGLPASHTAPTDELTDLGDIMVEY